METYFSTGQSPQRAVVSTKQEEEEEEEKEVQDFRRLHVLPSSG